MNGTLLDEITKYQAARIEALTRELRKAKLQAAFYREMSLQQGIDDSEVDI